MIFKPELARKVVDGSKTMTRRKLPCHYGVGRWYKVQPGRGKFHVCHVLTGGVRDERLGDITLGDAWAEGFKRVSDFVDYWMQINKVWNPNERVAVISWSGVEVRECCAELSNKEVKA